MTDPADDINWVYGLSGSPQRWMNPRVYLLLVMATYPIAFHWPAHLESTQVFPSPSDVAALDRAPAAAARLSALFWNIDAGHSRLFRCTIRIGDPFLTIVRCGSRRREAIGIPCDVFSLGIFLRDTAASHDIGSC